MKYNVSVSLDIGESLSMEFVLEVDPGKNIEQLIKNFKASLIKQGMPKNKISLIDKVLVEGKSVSPVKDNIIETFTYYVLYSFKKKSGLFKITGIHNFNFIGRVTKKLDPKKIQEDVKKLIQQSKNLDDMTEKLSKYGDLKINVIDAYVYNEQYRLVQLLKRVKSK